MSISITILVKDVMKTVISLIEEKRKIEPMRIYITIPIQVVI